MPVVNEMSARRLDRVPAALIRESGDLEMRLGILTLLEPELGSDRLGMNELLELIEAEYLDPEPEPDLLDVFGGSGT